MCTWTPNQEALNGEIVYLDTKLGSPKRRDSVPRHPARKRRLKKIFQKKNFQKKISSQSLTILVPFCQCVCLSMVDWEEVVEFTEPQWNHAVKPYLVPENQVCEFHFNPFLRQITLEQSENLHQVIDFEETEIRTRTDSNPQPREPGNLLYQLSYASLIWKFSFQKIYTLLAIFCFLISVNKKFSKIFFFENFFFRKFFFRKIFFSPKWKK